MTDTPLESAVTRLARAIARLERRPPPPTPPAIADASDGPMGQELARLEERHARLRARVQDVIGELDGLIAVGEAA